jgi:hypothetical protein
MGTRWVVVGVPHVGDVVATATVFVSLDRKLDLLLFAGLDQTFL